ncbi:GNAT family N-acetyltransferase [uncultured Sphingomonas sp.]|uniref:GNAT family N-acetyltransferase n=1 Tax=uncultured Sphingomonas sp. TaxID=158754 RepID=UPI0035CAF606
MTHLLTMTDADFAWLLGEHDGPEGLTIAEGGIGADWVTEMVRDTAAEAAAFTSRDLAWMIAEGDEVVGMISATKPAGRHRFEVGYGVAASREGRGHTTAAVGHVLDIARAQGLAGLTAETAPDNPGSRRVLEKNGFVRAGMRFDPDDGAIHKWSHDLGAAASARN